MYKISVKNCKNQLRKNYKIIRNSLSENLRKEYSHRITERIVNSDLYKSSENIFLYVSIGTEVDTFELIQYSIDDGKKVAVPYCIPNTCSMDFYYITNISELCKGTFGVYQPLPEKSHKAENKNGIIIVPALAFDNYGYRMGYGKGYYDRYLTDFCGEKIGICYSCCVRKCIIHDRFDLSVNYIITDNFTKFIAK